jgi:hypothetical protein
LTSCKLADWQGAYVPIFDTETTGLPKRWDAPITDTDNWPRCIQIAWQLHDDMGKLIEHQDYLVKPDGFNILMMRSEFTVFLLN